MFSPKYPTPDTPPAHVPAPYIPPPLQAAPPRPAVRLTPGSVLTLVAGGALVLVVGTVLVSLLLAVAVTAASVAVCAVVVRSILQSDRRWSPLSRRLGLPLLSSPLDGLGGPQPPPRRNLT